MAGDPRTRVAYFVPPSRHFAGIERVVHEIATGLAEAYGDLLDVHVVFATDYDDELLRGTPYTRHVLGVDRLRHLGPALRRCVRTHRFDVLVCPQVEASVTAWTATRGLRPLVFVTHLHGNPRIEEAEGSRRTRLAFALFRAVVSRRIAGVIAVSPSLAAYAARELVRNAPVLFAPNPVRVFPEVSHPTDGEQPFSFLSVARLSRQKGQDLLLRALAQARPRLPSVRLTLVGSGPEEGALRELCTGLGLDDVVTFAGYAADPAAYFRTADCFVLPSRWEGFGVVLVEALSFGLPLLATDCEFGPADVVTDSRIGELVAAGDPAALAEGLVRAAHRVGDPEDADARRAVARGYTREATAGAHLETLRRLAAAASVPGGRLAALTTVPR